jgi:hypothetical protein
VVLSLVRNGACAVAAVGGNSSGLGRTLPANDGPSGRAFATGTVQQIDDLRQQRERDPLLLGAQSMIAAPIIAGSNVVGVISVGHEQSGAYTADDAQALVALGRLLGAVGASGSTGAVNDEQLARIEQAMAKLRWPIGRMADLQMRFEQAGPLTSAQRETLMEFSTLVQSMNRALNPSRN